MKKSLKQYWWILLFLIILPFAINFLVLLPSPINNKWVAGEPMEWVGIWTTYIGAIASFAMIFITALTLSENRKQFIEQKKQYELEKLDEVSKKLFDFQTSINMLEVVELVGILMKHQYDGVSKAAKLLIRDIDEKSFAIDLMLPRNAKSREQSIFNKVHNDIMIEYGSIIQDIIWLNDLLKDMPIERKVQYLQWHLDNYGQTFNPNNCIKTIILDNVSDLTLLDTEDSLKTIFNILLTNNNISENKEYLKDIIIKFIQSEKERISNDPK